MGSFFAYLPIIYSCLNYRITQTLGQEAQLGHAFLFSVNNLAQLQTVLVEQIIPQLAQATGGQVALLQYLFNDEQQPAAAQFIHDSQSNLHQQPDMNHQNFANQSAIFASQNAFVVSPLGHAGYSINPDLIAQTGEFANPSVYQRLY